MIVISNLVTVWSAGWKVRLVRSLLESFFTGSICLHILPRSRSTNTPTIRHPLTLTEICMDCQADPSRTTHTLLSRTHLAQSRLSAIHKICSSCSSTPLAEPIMCDSIDCPVMYQRVSATRDVEDLKATDGVLGVVAIEPEGDKGTEGKKPFWEAMEW